MSGCSLQSFLNSNSNSNLKEESSLISTNYLPKIEYILGCCNGVLCFSSPYAENGSYFLWNPATRVLVELPELQTNFHKFGFGWDESSGAFKVFATLTENSKISGQLYSSKTNAWKTVPLGSRSLHSLVGVFIRGSIHWAKGINAGQEHVIEYFDLKSDEFGRIELPPFDENAFWPWTSLGEIGGCLCSTLFHYNKGIDFWVMKEYGVKDSWSKLLTFPFADFQYPAVLAIPPLIGQGPNGEIFIIYLGTRMLYSPKDDAFSEMKDGSFSRAHIYGESLVSPLTNTM